jgi:hypothetical protein
MPTGKLTPAAGGGTSSLAIGYAHAVLFACQGGTVLDARYQTLQKRPAPIVHLDVAHPFPMPVHPPVPLPGDPGAYATSRALEDR